MKTCALSLVLALAFNPSTSAQTVFTPPIAASTIATQSIAPSDLPVFTLADLIRMVVQNNPALLASQRSREASAATITSAAAWPNPKLEVGTGTNSARLPSANGGAVSGWALTQLIENPEMRGARINAARFAERSSGYQVVANTNELVAQVRLKTLEYLLRQEEAKAAAEALALLQQIRNRVKVRVESGEAARYEIIKADAEIINARQKVETTYLQIDQHQPPGCRRSAGALGAGG